MLKKFMLVTIASVDPNPHPRTESLGLYKRFLVCSHLMRKPLDSLQNNLLLRFAVFPILLILWFGFPLNTMAQSVDCNDTFVQLASNELVIKVAATNNDDTDNIQCALDAAIEAGIPTVRLAAGTYFISSLVAVDFKGTLEGRTTTSTIIEVLNESINCDGMADAGLIPSVIKFVEGEPRIRFMTIRANHPCVSNARVHSIVHFTGEPATANNCSNDVIFGVVDRVHLDGTDVETGPTVGVEASAEGNVLGGCKDTLLGTFKLNRSEVANTGIGIVTRMKASAQVDINFNEFVNNFVGVFLFNTNQNTTITGNNFFGGSPVNFSYSGVLVGTDSQNAPTKTRAVINKNVFNVSSPFGNLAVAFVQVERIANISSVVSNNTFNLSGIDTWGVLSVDVSNVHVSTNRFNGFGYGAVGVDGFFSVSGWTITANTGLAGFSSDFADIALFQTTSQCIVGPGQGATVANLGLGNRILNSVVQPPTLSGATMDVNTSSKNGLSDIRSKTLRHLEDLKQMLFTWQ